jgi:hypothetical protein
LHSVGHNNQRRRDSSRDWQQIKQADIIVADVSGQNGNVMLELGVAAAWRDKEQVIILREEKPEEKHLFDINPRTHIEYTRTSSGFEVLKNKLRQTMFDTVAAAPFEDMPTSSAQLPVLASLDNGQDCPDLLIPSPSHRRMLKDCLEFGSLYSFPRSYGKHSRNAGWESTYAVSRFGQTWVTWCS